MENLAKYQQKYYNGVLGLMQVKQQQQQQN